MNLKFLGDALDHWKGALFESLQQFGTIERFAVDPMATDLSSWRQEDFDLFARLLHVRPEQIISHRVDLRDRHGYFAEIRHDGDIFLDPDTGVSTGRVEDPARYVRPSEINDLLDTSSRLVVVYQHVRAQHVAGRVDAVVAALMRQAGSFGWCSYESGTVAMIFLARQASRTAKVERHFSTMLGRHADGRIRSGPQREV